MKAGTELTTEDTEDTEKEHLRFQNMMTNLCPSCGFLIELGGHEDTSQTRAEQLRQFTGRSTSTSAASCRVCGAKP